MAPENHLGPLADLEGRFAKYAPVHEFSGARGRELILFQLDVYLTFGNRTFPNFL